MNNINGILNLIHVIKPRKPPLIQDKAEKYTGI